MPEILPDEDVDAIGFEPSSAPDHPDVCRLMGPRPPQPLDMLLSFQGWSRLRYWLDCLRAGTGGAFDDVGFVFDTDDDAGELEPFTGVEIHDPLDEQVIVSREAFDRLMARFFLAIADAAEQQGDPATTEKWWPDFAAAARALGD